MAQAKPAPTPTSADGYFQLSELPLTSLLFVLPLIVLYEVGTWAFNSDPTRGTEQRIIAFNLLQQFFGLFGAYGRYLPALAVGGILLAWHVARRDPWRLHLPTLMTMGWESVVWSLPLLLISLVFANCLPLYAVGQDWRGLVVLSIGAGVYEELVFRLMALTALNVLLMDLLNLPKPWGVPLILVIAAVLFSAYHYLGSEPFAWGTFTFRTIAGLFFGVVFVYRGFGVSAGCHAAYDIIVVFLATVPRL